MDRKTITAIVIVIVVVAGMFLFAQMQSSQIQSEQNSGEIIEPDQDTQAGPYDHIERIDAKHFYIDGTHTLVGEIMMPTSCDLLEWNTQVAESFPEQVTIEFTVINNADVCAQVLTPQRFKVDFRASENAAIRATLEGRNVELNRIPPAGGETPDDFELFIKG